MEKANCEIIDGKRNGICEIFFCSKSFSIVHFVKGEESGLTETYYQKYNSNIFEISEIKFY